MLRQGGDTIGELLILTIGGQYGPSCWTIHINFRCTQIIGQCSAQRLFKPFFNLQAVNDLPTLCSVAFNQFRQRRYLGTDRIGFPFCF